VNVTVVALAGHFASASEAQMIGNDTLTSPHIAGILNGNTYSEIWAERMRRNV
jgi:hypothetical protein